MSRKQRSRVGAPKWQHRLPRDRQQLRPSDWPAQDWARWQRAQVRNDPFDEDGMLADSAPRSVKLYAEAYGLFIAWLDSISELDPKVALEQRVTAARIGRFILNMRNRCTAQTIDVRLAHLKTALRALAPAENWDWITRHPLAPNAKEIRASRKPISKVDSAAILAQGRSLMDGAIMASGQRTAITFRNGLMLVVQTLFTLRLRNLAEITIGVHLVRRGQRWFLQFQETVKNKADLDYEVPGWLASYLEIYLDHHRPILLGDGPDHGGLWVCDDGEPMKPGGVHAVFDHLCRTPDGKRLSTHPFRHAKATAFILRNPANLDLAAAALGHDGVGSVNQVYDRSGGISASHAWNAIRRKRFGRSFDDE